MADPTGLAAVLAEAVGDRAIVPAPAEQLDLADLLGLREVREERRGRGRPKGQINRRTEIVAEYLLSKYPDPLEGLIQMCGIGIDELSAALNCTAHEAWAEKRLCIQAVLPYLHRRMPLAVDLSNRSVVHLSINTGSGVAGASPEAGLTILGSIAEVVENQEVIDEPDAPV